MEPLTDQEQAILDGLFAKAALPGYDVALDTTAEERRVAAKHLVLCLQELGRHGVRAQLVVGRPAGEGSVP
jgi:hypothetical protein